MNSTQSVYTCLNEEDKFDLPGICIHYVGLSPGFLLEYLIFSFKFRVPDTIVVVGNGFDVQY